MVAEPVHATLQTLNYFYQSASDIIATQLEKFANLDYVERLHEYNIFHPRHSNKQPLEEVGSYSVFNKLYLNILNNRVKYFSILSLGLSAGIYVCLSNRKSKNIQQIKRRVPKLPNGARRDVILMVGSPTEPLTRLIALDFEKRGFIVYLTILDDKDFKYVEANPITDDINYLNLSDTTCSFESQIFRFKQLLDIPVVPFPGSEPHSLRLVGTVFAPSLYFPLGPIENIHLALWNRVNDRFMIYLKLLSSGLINLVRTTKSKIIIINTNIISSLNMPYHAPETLFQNSIKHLFTSLTREINHHNLSITQVRLGNLHISNNGNTRGKISSIINSEIRSWDDEMKSLYATDFTKSQYKANPIRSTGKGTNLRELYHLLFDLLYSDSKNPSVVYCGTGARLYDWISRICPEFIIEWFLR